MQIMSMEERMTMSRLSARTFLTGEVGVVTWLVGLVGDDTEMLAGVGVVLLLTAADCLFLSVEGGRTKKV